MAGTPRFGHQRLACDAGYADSPQLRTTMTFELVQRPSLISRVVIVQERTFECWSPNSQQHVFLPGERRLDFVPTIPAKLHERRYDGHAGRHDCLFFPQFPNSASLHWPFMRRAHLVEENDPSFAAYLTLDRAWVGNTDNPLLGFFDPQFLGRLSALRRELDRRIEEFKGSECSHTGEWEARPQYASAGVDSSSGESQELGISRRRRGGGTKRVKRKGGLVRMMEARHLLRDVDLNTARNLEMPVADDRYIGMWVNGVKEWPVLLYMAAGVPCFVLHEYGEGEVSRDQVDDRVPVFTDFLGGTEALGLLRESRYQQIAREEAFRLDAVPPEGNAAPDAGHGSQLRVTTRRASPLPVPPISTAAAASASTLLASSANVPAPVRLYCLPLDRVTVHPDRVQWVKPPPIAGADQKGWTKWELTSYQGIRAWLRRGKDVKIRARNEWFDREHKRRLFLRRRPFRPTPSSSTMGTALRQRPPRTGCIKARSRRGRMQARALNSPERRVYPFGLERLEAVEELGRARTPPGVLGTYEGSSDEDSDWGDEEVGDGLTETRLTNVLAVDGVPPSMSASAFVDSARDEFHYSQTSRRACAIRAFGTLACVGKAELLLDGGDRARVHPLLSPARPIDEVAVIVPMEVDEPPQILPPQPVIAAESMQLPLAQPPPSSPPPPVSPSPPPAASIPRTTPSPPPQTPTPPPPSSPSPPPSPPPPQPPHEGGAVAIQPSSSNSRKPPTEPRAWRNAAPAVPPTEARTPPSEPRAHRRPLGERISEGVRRDTPPAGHRSLKDRLRDPLSTRLRDPSLKERLRPRSPSPIPDPPRPSLMRRLRLPSGAAPPSLLQRFGMEESVPLRRRIQAREPEGGMLQEPSRG
ncbi:hypothetical protein R3P38DRAFT_3177695 [Favolaschia claudopus]|uniref:Uncharacterized protein n=1 Tax=Favolaschia claudopus TaxID=2862362 RepID=A0AAW0CYM3_9AGAR